MYLRELRVVNDGPTRDVGITLTFGEDGTPKPLVIVGENGTGKSNLLSIIADAVVEGAAQHHSDIVPQPGGVGRPWLRIVGGATLRRGSQGGFALVRFDEAGDSLIYAEKAGHFPSTELPEDLSPELKAGAAWSDDGAAKAFPIGEERSRAIYSSGCYAYFPASRSETPHWLNGESLPSKPFSSAPRFTGRLGKSLFVEHGIDAISQWIPGLLLDSRAALVKAPATAGPNQWLVTSTTFEVRLAVPLAQGGRHASTVSALVWSGDTPERLWHDPATVRRSHQWRTAARTGYLCYRRSRCPRSRGPHVSCHT